MKKTLLVLIATLVCSITQAAITQWSTGLVASNYDGMSYANGTAYFFSVANGGPQLADMIASITQNGLTGESDFVTLLGDAVLTERTAGATTYWQVANVELSPTPEIDSTATYYTLFVSNDGKSFVFSEGLTSSDTAFGTVNDPTGQQATPNFIEGFRGNASSWSNNGGLVGPVPEPTALALLALGVAGVALRRRVR